ncbi:MAG TPA: AsmA family protein [Methyloceanibacter sp.]|nr:AsmA family protein [Methyloceanibacter sp.]
MEHQNKHKTPPAEASAPQDGARRWLMTPRSGPMKLLLMIGAGVVAVAVVALIAVNLLISADAVRDRVAARIKEQTGRELKVNGTTSLMFTPGPHIVITDAAFTDPEARAGTADFSVARLVLDLDLAGLLTRQVEAKRVVLERPVLTVRLGSNDRADAPAKRKEPGAGIAKQAGDRPQRDVKLQDVRIEDGMVIIAYDDKGTEKRIEHIAANLSLPTITDPLTGTGKLDWKDQTVDFSFQLTSPADLRQSRPARLVLAIDTPAIAARFDGNVSTRPKLSGEGQLSAKAHSIPSLLAWMREKPPSATAIGDGELASHLAWNDDEITFSAARFALEHVSGQGEAVVTLQSPRPHIRAALALDNLDLNPFLSSTAGKTADAGAKPQAAESAAPSASPQAQTAAPNAAPQAESDMPRQAPEPGAAPSAPETAAVPPSPEADAAPPSPEAEAAPPQPPQAPSVAPVPAPVASPASVDADVNLNVRKTRVGHLDLGPSSLGLAFRDGVLNATLGGMELYDGHASGKLVLDVSKPVPSFTGDFRLDGVQAKTLLSDAAQFSLLEGHTKLSLQIGGGGNTAEEIKSSLAGQGSVAVSDGSIEGVDITGFISSLGSGQIPELRQGPGAKTAFTDLGGSFAIKNGIAETSNLKMTSPLLQVTAAGTVNLTQSSLDILAHPEIVAGPEGKGGANDLAGLSVPVRIEGPLDSPRIKPEIKGMFANPEQASKTVKQIGDALQKKFKGKPVGEAIGRFLGNVQIVPRGGGAEGDGAPPASQKQPGKGKTPQAEPTPEAGTTEQGDSNEPDDPDLDRILR